MRETRLHRNTGGRAGDRQTCPAEACAESQVAPGGNGRGNIQAVNSEMVGKAHAAGDPVAKEVMRETLDLLAYWLGNIIDLLEPDILVIGGAFLRCSGLS